MLLLQAIEPDGLLVAQQVRLRLLGELQEEPGVAGRKIGQLAPLHQLGPGELADRLQHSKPRFSARRLSHH